MNGTIKCNNKTGLSTVNGGKFFYGGQKSQKIAKSIYRIFSKL